MANQPSIQRTHALSRLFLSHASADSEAAAALGEWLAGQGYADTFLDIDPQRGLAAGERWMDALKAAADRCEAVLCLVSPAWLASRWCLAEFLLAKSLHKRIFGLIIEPVPFERLPPEMTAEWQLCELTGADEVCREGKPVRFQRAGLDRLRRGLERAGLDARGFPWPPPNEPDRAPYRGLRALEPQDAAIFFGRDALIIRGMDQIRGMAELGVDKLLVVLGASGAGKSSFLRAGLWPRLARDDAHFLPLPVIRPQGAVISGSTGLAVALATAFERFGAARAPGRVKQMLAAEGAAALGTMLDELAELATARLVRTAGQSPAPTPILALDQAEELFNAEGAAEADILFGALAALLAGGRPTLVIVTVRTDRYHNMQGDALLPGIKRVLFDLPPIAPAEFKGVIEGPAQRVSEGGRKLEIEPALTEVLVADSIGADALPLLGFSLERLWLDYGAHGRLTLDDYRAMGGVQGSIEAAVAAALANPDQPPAIPTERAAQHTLLRAAFIPWLARVDPLTGQRLRRSASVESIPPASRAVLDRFVAARLLVVDRRQGVDVVEVAHESLLRQWHSLLAWLDADAADLKLVEEVERAASEWDRNGCLDAWLDHRADRLEAAERLVRRHEFAVRAGDVGLAYVSACRALAEREHFVREAALIRQGRLQRRVAGALAAFALVLALGVGGAVWQRRDNLALQTNLQAEQNTLAWTETNFRTTVAADEWERGNLDGGLRIAVFATLQDHVQADASAGPSPAPAQLTAGLWESGWRVALRGCANGIPSAAFSTDGTRIVTACGAKIARLWDAASGRAIAVLRGHTAGIRSVAFSLDGRRIVTASEDNTARIWDAANGRPILVLRGHEGAVASAAFSPDGSRIVTASEDSTARIWDVTSGKTVAVVSDGSWIRLAEFIPTASIPIIEFAAYSRDGRRIVTILGEHRARVWDAASGRQVAVIGGNAGWVASAAFSPDGTQVVTTAYEEKTARIWDVASGKQISTLEGHRKAVNSATYSPDGSRIVTASDDTTVRIWDAAGGHQIAVLHGHENGVVSAAYSVDSTRIVTASTDGTVRVWPTASKEKIVVPGGDAGWQYVAAYSAEGARLAARYLDDTMVVWDTATWRKTAVLHGDGSSMNAAAFNTHGSLIATTSGGNTARVWDATSGHLILTLQGHEGPVESAAFSRDGTRIVTASQDKTARIWESARGRQVGVLRGHDSGVDAASFSPDGRRVVTASLDNTARVWDVAGGRQVLVLQDHDGPVSSAVYSPDGARIVTTSFDHTARVWDSTSGRRLAVLRGHEDTVDSAEFSPDGTRILTVSGYTARVWDASSYRNIAILGGQERERMAAFYTPDGAHIITASSDGSARMWDGRQLAMSTQQVLTEVCTSRLRGISTLTPAEMELLGQSLNGAAIDVCAGVGKN